MLIHTKCIVLMNLALYSNLRLEFSFIADICPITIIVQYIWSIWWIVWKCSNGKYRPRWKLKPKLHKFNEMARNTHLRLINGEPFEFERFSIDGNVRERFEVYDQRRHCMRWNPIFLSMQLNAYRAMRTGRYMMRSYLLSKLIVYVFFIYLIKIVVLCWQLRWMCNANQRIVLLVVFIQALRIFSSNHATGTLKTNLSLNKNDNNKINFFYYQIKCGQPG